MGGIGEAWEGWERHGRTREGMGGMGQVMSEIGEAWEREGGRSEIICLPLNSRLRNALDKIKE